MRFSRVGLSDLRGRVCPEMRLPEASGGVDDLGMIDDIYVEARRVTPHLRHSVGRRSSLVPEDAPGPPIRRCATPNRAP